MHSEPQTWLAILGRALSLAILAAGGVLGLRLLHRWSRGAWAPPTGERLRIRLQARPWHPADAGVLLLALLLPALLNSLQAEAPRASSESAQLAPVLIFYCIILAGVAAAGRRTGLGFGHALGISRETLAPSLRAGLVLGLASLPPVILVACFSEWLLQQLGVPLSRQGVFDTLADPGLGLAAQTLLIIIALVVAPLAEEAVFRGVIFPVALRNAGLFRSLLLVNVLFALIHLHLPSFLPLLTIGICLSLGMLASGSLLTPVVMHAIFNGEMLLIFYVWPSLAS